MKLRVSPEAISDISEIKRYIRDELCSPAAAARISEKLVGAYKSLKTSPFIGTPLDSVIAVKTDYRFLVCDNYLIFYRVDGDTVFVYRIFSARRDFCRQLFKISYTELCDSEEE